MKNIKKILISIFVFFVSIMICEASSFQTGLVASSTVNINNDVAVSISLSNLPTSGLASAQYYVTFDNTKLSYTGYNVGQGKPSTDYNISVNGNRIIILYVDNAGGENSLKNGTFATLKFKTIAEGTATISLTGEGFSTIGDNIEDLSSNSSNISLNIIEPTTVKPTTTTTKTNNFSTNTTTTRKTTTKKTTTTTKKVDDVASDKTLNKLEIEGVDLKFNKNILDYVVNVSSDVEKLNISYETSNKNAKVEILNNKLVIGENVVTIKVIAEDKSEREYKIKVIKSDNKSTAIEYDKIKLIDLIKSSTGNIEVDIEISDKYKIIEKEIMDLIKSKSIEVKFNIKDKDTTLYYIVLNDKNIDSISDDLDLSFGTILNSDINLSSQNYKIINLLNNSTLNNIDIYYNVNSFGNNIYVYRLKENEIELINQFDKTSDFITLNLDSQQYLISNDLLTLNKKNNMFIILGVILGICFIIMASLIIFIILKNKKKEAIVK